MGGCTAIDGCPGDRQTTNPVRQAQVLHHRELLLLALLVQQLQVLEAVELGEELPAVAVGEFVEALRTSATFKATNRLGSLSLMSSRPLMVKRKYSERPCLTTAFG